MIGASVTRMMHCAGWYVTIIVVTYQGYVPPSVGEMITVRPTAPQVSQLRALYGRREEPGAGATQRPARCPRCTQALAAQIARGHGTAGLIRCHLCR